ncbi:hypothetical protein NQ315_005933 [Exocentrus adspersus]|uniref:Uncharacterized protein n=1 Tax=Exocentrus adspersus TaxID=1586481 RepID=A0AAV8VDW4_9CUCU|nr:hypothetical protein NQ315_005933 [Exocentrus adspersus]
MDTFSAKFK